MTDVIIPRGERVCLELDLGTLAAPLDPAAVFGNDHPLEVEIGIGKGYFILNAAKAAPEHNFIGIEFRRKYLMQARDRVEKRGLANVRFVCSEAFSFLEDYLAPASVTTFHLYFPDPWPKKRHHKRRLFSPGFLASIHRLLVPGGLILIATDHADYHEWMREILGGQDLLVESRVLPEPPPGADGLTNWEIKFIKEGRPSFRLGYRKP